MVLVSLYATYDIAVSLPKIAGMVYGLSLYYAVVQACDRPRAWHTGLSVLIVGGVGVAGLGLLGTRWSAKFPALAPLLGCLPLRIGGLPGAAEGFHPNEVAGALLWVIPLALVIAVVSFGRILNRQSAIGKHQSRIRAPFLLVIIAGASVLMTAVLLLTQSRGGLIAFSVTVLLMLLVAVRKSRWLVGGLIASIVVAAVAIAYVGPAQILQAAFGPAANADSALSLNTLEGRVELWSRAIYGIQDFPFTGMGMNTFRRVVHVLYPLFLVGPDVDIGHAHNEFLQAALDLGIPGLVAFIAIYLGAFWMLFQVWRQARHRLLDFEVGSLSLPFGPLALGLGGGLLAHMLYGLTDAVALGAKPGVLFWILLGLIAGLYKHIHGDPAATHAPDLPKSASQ